MTLTASTARQLIRTQFPELAALPVTFLGQGLDHVAFDVGKRFVFRFPVRPDVATADHAEARLLSWLAPRLPLPVPAAVFVGEPGPTFPLAFFGLTRLEGTPASLAPSLLQATRTGEALGSFLRALHDQDAAEAARLRVDVEGPESLAEWSGEALRHLGRAVEHGDVTTEEAAFWHPALSTAPVAYAGPPRLLHGDFAAEHVLLDEQGLPTGVIDWTDARLGDPALDLAGLVYWANPVLLEAALLAYGGVDAATLARARWYAACRALEDLDFGHETVRHEYTNAGRRALAFLARP